MKNKSLIILLLCVILLFAGCIPSQYKKGVEADEYPEKDLPVYDDAIIFEYEEDDENVTIKYGTKDDVDDVMDFYQDYFEDEEIVLYDEDKDKDEYSAEGLYEDFFFKIDVEEARGENEEKVFSSVVEVKIEFISDEELRAYAISDARVIISCVNVHNVMTDIDDTLEFISYDEFMSIDTVDEFNSICEIDVTMSDEEFNNTKEYILEDSDGFLEINNDYDYTD